MRRLQPVDFNPLPWFFTGDGYDRNGTGAPSLA